MKMVREVFENDTIVLCHFLKQNMFFKKSCVVNVMFFSTHLNK